MFSIYPHIIIYICIYIYIIYKLYTCIHIHIHDHVYECISYLHLYTSLFLQYNIHIFVKMCRHIYIYIYTGAVVCLRRPLRAQRFTHCCWPLNYKMLPSLLLRYWHDFGSRLRRCPVETGMFQIQVFYPVEPMKDTDRVLLFGCWFNRTDSFSLFGLWMFIWGMHRSMMKTICLVLPISAVIPWAVLTVVDDP